MTDVEHTRDYSLAREAALYAAAAGLTLIEPRSLSGWKKQAYWAAVSLLTGATAVSGIGETGGGAGGYVGASARGRFVPDVDFVAVNQFLGVAGVTFGLQQPLLKADAWAVDTVRSWGVRRPRLLLAALSLLAGVVMVAIEARREKHDFADEVPEVRDLNPRVRQVTAEILARTDDWGAPELRAQFGQAKQVGEMRHGFVQFEVPDDVDPLPVDFFVFPVHGRGELDGVEVTVALHVEMGRLAGLSIDGPDELELRLPDDLTYVSGFED